MKQATSQTLITGCYRSGTEYITQLLGNQPDLTTTMYVTNFMRYYWGEYDPVSDPKNYTDLVFDASQTTRQRWGREIDPHRVLDEVEDLAEVDYASLYDLIMSDLVITEEIDHWAEKIQLVWRSIPEFVDNFENGRAILIVRDPRSVLASFKNYTYEPEPAYLGAVFNMLDVFQKAEQYSRTLAEDQFHLMRYEDVIYEPENTLIKAFDFLGLLRDHDLLSQDGWTDTGGDPWGSNSAFDGDFDPDKAVNRWKNRLDPWEVAICEWVVGETMVDFGYEPAGYAPPAETDIDVLRDDPELAHYLVKWQEHGTGVESFPSDPTDPDNWEENAEDGEK
jgi:hypothetical protein